MLGASVGVLGTVGTAVLTYLAARKQADDQGRVTHRSALRAERRDAYLAFLQAHESIDGALNVINIASVPEIAVLDRAIELVDRGAHEIYVSQSRVELAGPESVCGAALEAWGAALNLRSFLDEVRAGLVSPGQYDGQCEARIDEVERCKATFTAAARSVLVGLA
ncbi:hypothetical protein JCM4814A_04320 [Streptomyces phaeofaciens JCM 4814]|uniref:Uncharacterized protein n=1 Tax=Streptomyces phaeofaciens TaxID=68254 RepID=A0A918HRV1_9ACTN|nr:hypothetical protein GCM10010226_92280 [Streptomyces phaeofaciens]